LDKFRRLRPQPVLFFLPAHKQQIHIGNFPFNFCKSINQFVNPLIPCQTSNRPNHKSILRDGILPPDKRAAGRVQRRIKTLQIHPARTPVQDHRAFSPPGNPLLFQIINHLMGYRQNMMAHPAHRLLKKPQDPMRKARLSCIIQTPQQIDSAGNPRSKRRKRTQQRRLRSTVLHHRKPIPPEKPNQLKQRLQIMNRRINPRKRHRNILNPRRQKRRQTGIFRANNAHPKARLHQRLNLPGIKGLNRVRNGRQNADRRRLLIILRLHKGIFTAKNVGGGILPRADDTRRHPRRKNIVRNIFGHHRIGSNNRPRPHTAAGSQRRMRSNPRPLSNPHRSRP